MKPSRRSVPKGLSVTDQKSTSVQSHSGPHLNKEEENIAYRFHQSRTRPARNALGNGSKGSGDTQCLDYGRAAVWSIIAMEQKRRMRRRRRRRRAELPSEPREKIGWKEGEKPTRPQAAETCAIFLFPHAFWGCGNCFLWQKRIRRRKSGLNFWDSVFFESENKRLDKDCYQTKETCLR